ncbi:Inositol-1,4,5-trisphosphate 5-phosphatase 1 [Thecaphora frezii]
MHVYLQDAPRIIALVGESDAFSSNSASTPAPSTTAVLISLQTSALAPGTSLAANGTAAASASSLSLPSSSSSYVSSSSRAVVEVVKDRELENFSLQKLTARPIAGCLGLINVGSDLFVAVVTSAVPVGAIRPGEEVMRITSVAFYCVNRSTWDETLISDSTAVGLDPYDSIGPGSDGAVTQPSVYEHPCTSLKKLLGTGTFYYAKDGAFDISTRLDQRIQSAIRSRLAARHDISQYDGRFVWNNYMIEPLIDFRERLEPADRARLDSECFLLLAIQGFVGVYDMPAALPATATAAGSSSSSSSTASSSLLGASTAMAHRPTCSIAVISRLSWKRAGTRFNTRGIDDDGNVANFVESETIFSTDEAVFSYNQVRGSVPLFWEQQGLQAFNARIQITRSRVASQPAFDRHFADLISHYSQVHAVNLLGTRDAETVLSAAYAEHVRSSSAEALAVLPPDEDANGQDADVDIGDRVGLTNFDFHAVSRSMGGLEGVRNELRFLGPVQLKRKAFGYTVLDPRDGTLLKQQRGVFRTNCLDCLDRTNVVQDILSQSTLESFLEAASGRRASFEPFVSLSHPLWTHHRVLWAENGDALSKIYAGTGALNTSFTRSGKKTLGGLLSDAAKSAGRMYINNFQDKGKQNVIDVLLGNMANQRPVTVFDPIVDSVSAELAARIEEYSSSHTVSIFAGTFNLNGKPPSESLLPWLFPRGEEEEPDIFAIGFQEIVQLTPQQIILTDPDKIRLWEGKIMETLSRRSRKRSDYVLLRSEQLVGTALIILVKEGLVHDIRQVEAATKKTGLKGMSGNKGGVAIRLDLSDTSICFVTAHFAAGHSNFEERNADYWTISRGLAFQRGRSIASHDLVLWLGDFNYRIDLPNEAVRSLALREDYDALYPRDQLGRSREAGAVFPGYDEGTLLFAPTYKYDNGSTTYDSSEKQRIPAWTDRILYRGIGIVQETYSRAELKTSDHRPVYSTFRAQVRTVDEAKKSAIKRDLTEQRRIKLGLGVHRAEDADANDDDDGDDEDPAAVEMPDPSDDNSNWWDVEARSGTEEEFSTEETDSVDGDDEGLEGEVGWTNINPFRSGSASSPSRTLGSATRGGYAVRQPPPPPPPRAVPSTSPAVLPAPLPSGNSYVDTASPASNASSSPQSAFSSTAALPPPSMTSTSTTSADRRVFSGPASLPAPKAVRPAALKPPPPPIPVKPIAVTAAAIAASVAGSAPTSATRVMPSITASEATGAPKVPLRPRPGLGPRSASYTSQRSAKSLLDDSE